VGSVRGDRAALALLLLVSSLPLDRRGVGLRLKLRELKSRTPVSPRSVQTPNTVPTSESLGSSRDIFPHGAKQFGVGEARGGQSALVGISKSPEVAGFHWRLLLLHALGAVCATHGGIDGVDYDLTVCPFPTTAGLERRDRMRWPCRGGAADHPAPPGDCLAHAASWWHSAPPRSPQQRSSRMAECRPGSAARPS
jgi:hypothetical protein